MLWTGHSYSALTLTHYVCDIFCRLTKITSGIFSYACNNRCWFHLWYKFAVASWHWAAGFKIVQEWNKFAFTSWHLAACSKIVLACSFSCCMRESAFLAREKKTLVFIGHFCFILVNQLPHHCSHCPPFLDSF